jgi:hypothetical protein
MLPDVLTVLPDAVTRCPPGVAAGCCAGGLGLWLAGGRNSRPILTLAGVALGTLVGMRLPGWYGWQVDGMGVAVGAAIALGACAFLFHRTCIGLLLGGGMMLWAGLAVWLACGNGATWSWHDLRWQGDAVQLLRDAWAALPPQLQRPLPLAGAAGLSAGVTLAVCFNKLSKVLAHSLVGVTLVAVMGMVAVLDTRPQWLGSLPGSNLAQGAVLVAMVLAGTAWQWRITPPRKAPTQHRPSEA